MTEATASVSRLRYFTVVDEAGQPFQGVVAFHRASNYSASTGPDGKVFLGLQPTEVAEFIYFGYETQKITITYASNYKVKMVPLPPEEPEEPKEFAEPKSSSSSSFYFAF